MTTLGTPTLASTATHAIHPHAVAPTPHAGERAMSAVGLALVPLPVLAYCGLRALGVPVGGAEDLVTVGVMLPLGGPHVVATLRRTICHGAFWQTERALAAASLLLLFVVAATAVTSAFFGMALAGRPAMATLLTLFFFWAGLHVVQQHVVVAARLQPPGTDPGTRWRRQLGAVVIVTSLYPIALFRMSMTRTDGLPGASPEALATRCLDALGCSPGFVDDYVFRIGRVAPVLPEMLLQAWVWVLAAAGFAIALLLFLVAALPAWRRAPDTRRHTGFVLAVALVGASVPLFPNLDVAFQGINSWHSFQYLALLAAPAGAIAPALQRPDPRSWARGVAVTAALVAGILVFAVVLERCSGGAFRTFGHDTPPTDPAGNAVYRPGGVLLGYYLFGFGFLLVHYLCDTVHFAVGALAHRRSGERHSG